MSGEIAGYVADIPYLRDFKPMLAPAWLDHVALWGGIAPPDRRRGFLWCDLGCGQGITAVVLAATHPSGDFYGIDAMPVHVENGRRLAATAGVSNIAFHVADFAAVAALDLPRFDYIVAHGVYTWIDPAAQKALRRIIDRHLAPGGLVYLGYNAMPGWARDLPFQRLARELAGAVPGNSAKRMAAAMTSIESLAEAPALAASHIVGELRERPQDYALPYLVHEFLHRSWRPLYVTEVRAALAAIGLVPIGSATLIENFEELLLGAAVRRQLAVIADRDLRELVRDYFLDQRFRCDVFARGHSALEAAERRTRLLGGTFALARPAIAISYATTTAAGPIRYDTPAARAIVDALSQGPHSLAAVGGGCEHDFLDAALALCAGGDAIPVEASLTPVEALNSTLWQCLDGPEEVLWLALPCGTALPVERELLRALRDGSGFDEAQFPGWPGFLAAHGLVAGRTEHGLLSSSPVRPNIGS